MAGLACQPWQARIFSRRLCQICCHRWRCQCCHSRTHGHGRELLFNIQAKYTRSRVMQRSLPPEQKRSPSPGPWPPYLSVSAIFSRRDLSASRPRRAPSALAAAAAAAEAAARCGRRRRSLRPSTLAIGHSLTARAAAAAAAAAKGGATASKVVATHGGIAPRECSAGVAAARVRVHRRATALSQEQRSRSAASA